MKKWIYIGCAAIAATGLAACGSDDEGTEVAAPAASTQATTNRTAPLHKNIGERAGLGCKDSVSNCIINFKVTKIEPIDCSKSSDNLSGHRVVRVSIDAEASGPIEGMNPPGAFLLSNNWMSRTADGYVQAVNTAWCGESSAEQNPGPFSDALQAGDKARGTENLVIQKDATALLLRFSGADQGWLWDVPS